MAQVLELPAAEMAAACGINYRLFEKLPITPTRVEKDKGRPRHIYLLPDVLVAYHQYHKTKSLVDGPDGTKLDKEQEEALKIREDRIARQLKNAKTLREQAPIEVMERALAEANSGVSAILTSLPLNIKRRHPTLPAAVIREIERELVKAQNMMADVKLAWSEDDT